MKIKKYYNLGESCLEMNKSELIGFLMRDNEDIPYTRQNENIVIAGKRINYGDLRLQLLKSTSYEAIEILIGLRIEVDEAVKNLKESEKPWTIDLK